ncbi:MAG: class I SAM-dependent methyltransferase [Aminobacteriaceae bacterium]
MYRSRGFYPMLAPIYPLLAQQYVDDYALERGVALDIGTGPGYLGVELAKITDMAIYFVDISEEALDKARELFSSSEADNEARFICADVRALPFTDGFADFIMSRGSLWFWEAPEEGLADIHRVLKPGGVAVVGGGLGRYIPASMRERIVRVNREHRERGGERCPCFRDFANLITPELMERAGVETYRMLMEDPEGHSGKWVEIRKE